MKGLRRVLADDGGATLAEYGLLVGLIATVTVASATLFGTELYQLYEHFATAVQNAI